MGLEADLQEPSYTGLLSGVGEQHRGAPVDGVLAERAAVRTRPRGENGRVRAIKGRRHRVDVGRLQVEDHRLGSRRFHICGLLRFADQPQDRVARRCQLTFQQQSGLSVPARDDDSHVSAPS
ncbi:hypothetical protein GCM10023196_061000 [Actinoallomurus vinaceus]|uniref:Uncharacterized protein n=1 Tax=Actinoallomurus vinaceus TaxID=1080074 RepID=A0ABP8UGK2_9ACTN